MAATSWGLWFFCLMLICMPEAPDAFRRIDCGEDEARAIKYISYVNSILTSTVYKAVVAEWNYVTNLTEYNKNKTVAQSLIVKRLEKEIWRNIMKFTWTDFKDQKTKRIFRKLSRIGTAILSPEKQDKLVKLVAEMQENHASAKVCPFRSKATNTEKCNLSLDPEIKNILKTSKNYKELLHVWNEFRKVAGKPMRGKFLQYVKLQNEAARLNGFKDASGMWLDVYEDDCFEEKIRGLWQQLKPLYQQLHAYVRSKLRRVYGHDKIKRDGPIPAHVLGHIHSQSWSAIIDITQPYPHKKPINVTNAMRRKKMTVLEVFKQAERFFTSMGLPPMPQTFWKRSILEKPRDRKIVCHPSAWDFYINNDVRIKQCTQVNMDDFRTVHHEMGHVEYFLKYAKQPFAFREGANPGFHEAIGDTIALSVSTPKHLRAVGLLKDPSDDYERDINYLFSVALDKVASIPSTYVYDLWRWNVFKGTYQPQNYNRAWWILLLKYQGICPGVRRSRDDFDPPAKYHISADVPYIRYFVSTVLQFQFYKALCDEAGHVGPLYKCDFYRSKRAGKLFGDVMALGSSKPWPQALAILTRRKTRNMDAGPLLEYFRPLYKWLKKRNKGRYIGWRSNDPTVCP
uniref:Angiotensin-converting enzyme n=1 Tax=Amblyomma maculatum TaxID=34609 RepID=G3MRB1_AMBMU